METPDSIRVQEAALAAELPPVVVTPHRCEVKIPLPSAILADVQAWVRLHPAHWRRPYPPRQVNNIYFDTPTYAGLNANLGGIGDRAKLRLRWYGDRLACVGDAHLELKRKQGTIGWKETLAVDVTADLRDIAWPDLVANLEGAMGSRERLWFRHFPLPVLINCYQRDYFATPDDVIRLTVDHTLRAYGQRASRVPNLSVRAGLADDVVVELKAPTAAGAVHRLNDALSYFPPSVGRFSKYVQGVMATFDFL